MQHPISPSQQRALARLGHALNLGYLAVLRGGDGMGKTTLLRELHQVTGGAFLTMGEYIDLLSSRDPIAMEETFTHWILEALKRHDLVYVDDLNLISDVVTSCSNYGFPRTGLFNAPAKIVATYAIENRKRLIFASDDSGPDPISNRAEVVRIPKFNAADYETFCRFHLEPAVAQRLDYTKIHRFATRLDGHQLTSVCRWLRSDSDLDTDKFIDYLRSQRMSSNVELGEVQQVSLGDLKGCDDVIERLEANIVLPLEHDEVAGRLGLRPKRGVLLAGPPGTGKTTVGRALAHRLKGKFFLVDGTIISGTGAFYRQIHQIFQAARENAPSVIFIDDSDVIFESGEELGLYRYLLTMLDGLESESSGQVCVMLTAMDVSNIPPALLRSGRIELWLEMRLPDESARAGILQGHLQKMPADLEQPDLPQLVAATEGFTGADLKRLVEDGKNLYAYDLVRKLPTAPITDYFLKAVEAVAANKVKYAEAEAQARAQRSQAKPGFGHYPGMYGPDDSDDD